MRINESIRVIGIDDSPKDKNDEVLVAGVICRGYFIEGILSTHTKFDGDDGTQKVVKMVKRSRFFEQIKVIMMNGIMLGGLNIVDIKKLSKELGMPVIAITRHKPRMERVKNAVAKVKNKKAKLRRLLAAGESIEFDLNKNRVFAQIANITREEAQAVINKVGIEPVRLAHIIASGIVTGESRGRV